jgi:branched-chain amino acid aminotransferase
VERCGTNFHKACVALNFFYSSAMAEKVYYNNEQCDSNAGDMPWDNHSFRYGDGVFESMKVSNGVIHFKEQHFERLVGGLAALRIRLPRTFTLQTIEEQVLELVKANNFGSSLRVRLTCFRSGRELFDEENSLQYVLQVTEAEEGYKLNTKGLSVSVFKDVTKGITELANFKTNNFLPYSIAAAYAKQFHKDDSIVLNTEKRICDSCIANIFVVRHGVIYTPSLDEGCIAGIMRRYIMERLSDEFPLIESTVTLEELMESEEVFLSNSIRGIRWVGDIDGKPFGNKLTTEVHRILFSEDNPEQH